MRKVLISAGEPSGDLHGAAVAKALKARWPDLELYGLGGDLMAAQGVRLLAHVDDLAVMGFAEVLRHLPFFAKLLRRVRGTFSTENPSLVLPIDYPGFNLRLARAARVAKLPVLYYITPQVWAWHRRRIDDLAESADRLAVILPFEEAVFREAGASATFVGHPLLDRPVPTEGRSAFAARLGLEPSKPLLALFPGSRIQEVHRHLDLFTAAARSLMDVRPDVQAVIAASRAVPRAILDLTGLPVAEDGWALLHHADVALVKSGTGTLEAALAQTPLVIAYRMHPLSHAIAKRLVRVDHVGLVNLVARERIAPEYIQRAATPEVLSAALLALLDRSGPERQRALAGMARVRAALRAPGRERAVAERVVDLAADLMQATA